MKPMKSLLLASVLASAVAIAAPLKTDPAKSSVTATFKQMGVPVEAKFKQFAAQIDYDAAKPAASKASVEIQTASLDLGDPDYNKEVTKKEWFNTAQFPKASFVSSAIAPAGAGKLNVSGKLTIKGRSADVSFPLSVKAEGGKQVFEGQLPIKRLAFNIGEGEWKDTSMVADEVVIKFRVTAGQ
ncbi:YceI family protein [Massilia alkalitolerans]|uniref:YceI family protein n=1 Tax=Massilia alkalitolerans TaxID=286638 RepID=UPI0003F8C21D|nr:YceI family protein [Massilia alkalitolerans]